LTKLRKLSRRHSRKQKGSNNRRKSAATLARHHWRITNHRQDFLHKLITQLSNMFQEICIEDLNVAGMIKNHALARHISDASWSEFRRQLIYKCEASGSSLVVRDRFYPSSKICHHCGFKVDSLSLCMRKWTCPNCHAVLDRDGNAAHNLCIPRAAREFTLVETGALAGSSRIDLVNSGR